MKNNRTKASSSLFGEGDDMLITGGRSLGDWDGGPITHTVLEIVGTGKPPVSSPPPDLPKAHQLHCQVS